MTPTVYLAGLISTEYQASIAWRDIAATKLVAAGWRVLNPMRGKKNLAAVSRDGGITSNLSAKSILLRDYNDVRQATVILALLETFDSKRPLVGTLIELGWAWEHHIPVVAVARKKNYLMRKHPFIAEFVSHYCESLPEALDHILNQYSK
jgi:nucleoside 2-deoxyribosyltransferase